MLQQPAAVVGTYGPQIDMEVVCSALCAAHLHVAVRTAVVPRLQAVVQIVVGAQKLIGSTWPHYAASTVSKRPQHLIAKSAGIAVHGGHCTW